MVAEAVTPPEYEGVSDSSNNAGFFPSSSRAGGVEASMLENRSTLIGAFGDAVVNAE